MKKTKTRQLPIVLSVVPLLVLVALIVFTIRAFGSDSLGGATQVMLLAASAVTATEPVMVPTRNFMADKSRLTTMPVSEPTVPERPRTA